MENKTNKSLERKKPSLPARIGLGIGGVALAAGLAFGGYKLQTAEDAKVRQDISALEVGLNNKGTVLKIGENPRLLSVVKISDKDLVLKRMNQVEREDEELFGGPTYSEPGVNWVSLPDDLRDHGRMGVAMVGKVPVGMHYDDITDEPVQFWVLKKGVSPDQAQTMSVTVGLSDTPNSQIHGGLSLSEDGDLVLGLSMAEGADDDSYYDTSGLSVTVLMPE